MISPQRLLLIVPYDIDSSFYTQIHEEFGIILNPPIQKKKKDMNLTDYLVIFDKDWTPEIITFKDATYHFDLKPIMERLGMS